MLKATAGKVMPTPITGSLPRPSWYTENLGIRSLILSSDCGMGREGMSRRHAFYKMVALVQGTNLVKKELGLPLTESLGADPKFSLLRLKK